MPIHQSYRNSNEILKISDISEKYHKQYDYLIMTFQAKVLPGLIEGEYIQPLEDRMFGSSQAKFPIYEVTDLPSTLFYICPISAPMAVGLLEEITFSMGVKHVIMYGSAGVLLDHLKEKSIIIPTKAYRDEGTSYHYMPSSDFIDVKNHEVVSSVLEMFGEDYIKGYTWTTDAFYRETQAIYEERISQGCIAVEMEISAVQAFSNLRGVELYTFIYSADKLSKDAWDKRILGKLSLDERMHYFFIAKAITSHLILRDEPSI